MNKKITTQLVLFFIILLFIALLFFKYFSKDITEKSNVQKIDSPLNLKENSSNSIENIEYISNDNLGNQYIIKAKYGEILDDNSNFILMKNVEAQIIFNNYEKVKIKSINATYNIKNYDTNFKENVSIRYSEHNIICDNVDLLFKDHKIKLYENINYSNLNTNVLADGMEIDLLTKNSKIYMNNKNKKIEITHKQ
tara:strand:+ start:274 stop:858 length:585 start_codon:yes stop_codon:yes gene_type:complete